MADASSITPKPLSLTDQEYRTKALECAALAHSGNQYGVMSPELIIRAAKVFEAYLKGQA